MHSVHCKRLCFCVCDHYHIPKKESWSFSKDIGLTLVHTCSRLSCWLRQIVPSRVMFVHAWHLASNWVQTLMPISTQPRQNEMRSFIPSLRHPNPALTSPCTCHTVTTTLDYLSRTIWQLRTFVNERFPHEHATIYYHHHPRRFQHQSKRTHTHTQWQCEIAGCKTNTSGRKIINSSPFDHWPCTWLIQLFSKNG